MKPVALQILKDLEELRRRLENEHDEVARQTARAERAEAELGRANTRAETLATRLDAMTSAHAKLKVKWDLVHPQEQEAVLFHLKELGK